MALKFRPWHPVTVNKSNDPVISSLEIRKCDCVAIQSVERGVASEDQQKMAWAAILHICGLNDLAWMPDENGGDRDTAFAAGKQHVGFQLRKLTKFPITFLTGENTDDGPEHTRRSGKPADERNATRAKQ